MQVKTIFKKSKDNKTTNAGPKVPSSQPAKLTKSTPRQHIPGQAQVDAIETQDIGPGGVVSYRNHFSPAQGLLQSVLSRDAARREPRRLTRRRTPVREQAIQEPFVETPVKVNDADDVSLLLLFCPCLRHR